jgi:hypothetical protein
MYRWLSKCGCGTARTENKCIPAERFWLDSLGIGQSRNNKALAGHCLPEGSPAVLPQVIEPRMPAVFPSLRGYPTESRRSFAMPYGRITAVAGTAG